MNEDALFANERRAIPADDVSIEQGKVSTSLELKSVYNQQKYDPSFL